MNYTLEEYEGVFEKYYPIFIDWYEKNAGKNIVNARKLIEGDTLIKPIMKSFFCEFLPMIEKLTKEVKRNIVKTDATK